MLDFNFIHHLWDQRNWSNKTFGPGMRTQGVVDHIRKELIEIEAKPSDLEEWIDVVMLGLDGAWRSGATPDQIAEALAAKLAKNKAREWPNWRTADPDKAIEHVRPATVKERADSIEITFDEDDEDWEVALELCEDILDSLDDLPERAEDFVESVREKTENIRDWIEEHEDVTDKQMDALENMKGGVERWQR